MQLTLALHGLEADLAGFVTLVVCTIVDLAWLSLYQVGSGFTNYWFELVRSKLTSCTGLIGWPR